MTDSKRREGAARAAAGLALVGAGEGVGQAVSGRGRVAGKVGSQIAPRGMKVVGVPLAATGLVGAARDRRSGPKVDVKELPGQVARRTVEVPRRRRDNTQRAKDTAIATLAGVGGGYLLRRTGSTPGRKIALGTTGSVGSATAALYGRQKGRETRRREERAVNKAMSDAELRRRKAMQSKISITGGTLGLAALGARGAGSKIGLRAAQRAGVKVKNPAATGEKLKDASNLLTTAGAGVGGVGAFNFAAYTQAESKRRRMTTQPVRKDRFLDTHRQHISTSAERGYEHLRRGRNKKAGWAAANAGLTAVNLAGTRRAGTGGKVLGYGLGALTGTNAIREARGAQRWNSKMDKIKAKAYERARTGELGRDRNPDDFAKALVRVRPPGLPFPKGRRRPALRAGSVRRTASGRMVAYRGSYG